MLSVSLSENELPSSSLFLWNCGPSGVAYPSHLFKGIVPKVWVGQASWRVYLQVSH